MNKKTILAASTLIFLGSILRATVYDMPEAMRPFRPLQGSFEETLQDGNRKMVVKTEGKYFNHSMQFHLTRTYYVADLNLDFSEFWVFSYGGKTKSKIFAWQFTNNPTHPPTYAGQWDNPPRKLVMTQTGGIGFKKDQVQTINIILPTLKGGTPKFNLTTKKKGTEAEQKSAPNP